MYSRSVLVLLLLLFCYAIANEAEHEEPTPTSFQVVRFHWESVKTPYMITIWLLVAAVSKILFHVLKPLTKKVPDSSLLIIVGLIIGFILHQSNADLDFGMDAHTFFLYLLPPIIFDAGYFMPNRALFENLDSVLLFSVVGTIWNTFSIGGSLLALSYLDYGWQFTTFEIFVFSALISAVDPVAVIAVFEECNVNEFLFVNVFGEALFNDGVTVVLYHMFKSFAQIGPANLLPIDYAAGCLSFVVVAVGGTAIGLIFAFITGFLTKYTYSLRILAPVFIFVVPYMAYLTAEMTSLSSIIAIAVCGMAMKQYVKGNVSTAAANSVKYFTKMLAGQSETVIFMFLGLSTISYKHHIDLVFIGATLFFCLLYRTIGVIVQCLILNKFRAKKFTKVDQFIMSYGGLRGAIAFGLATSMPDEWASKSMFVTATIAVIFFTVFLQGITIRPLVKYLNIETKDERAPTMTECIYNKYLDYMMSGIEDIAGQQGHYSFRDNFERFNAKILRPILLRNEEKKDFDASTIVRAYAKITLEDAMNLTTQQQKLQHKQLHKLKDGIKRESKFTNPAYETSDERTTQRTITPEDKQLQKFMADGHNVDVLYGLFSELLDRKLQEMNSTKETATFEIDDDIHDDYMKQMHSNAGSSNNLRSVTSSPAIATSLSRKERRQSTGGMRDKKQHSIV